MRLSRDMAAFRAEDIAADHPCLFWAAAPDEDFVRLVAELGQLSPLLVDVGGKGPSLVCGFKRLLALRALGRPALARTVEADELERGLLYLADNRGRTLDHGMRLAALQYFARLLPADRLAAEIGPRLGLDPRSRELRLLFDWLGLPEALQVHLVAGRLPLEASAVLARMAPGEQTAVEPFFAGLSWSRSGALQFLTWLFEAGRARARPLGELLAAGGFAATLAADLSPRDAIERLLAQARVLRFPTLADLEGRFRAIEARLTRGAPWRIDPPQHFESRVLELRARVKDARELARAAKALQDMTGSELWRELWGLGEGDASGGQGGGP